MSVTTGLFYAFSAVLLFAAFRVITARNPVHAALFLVLTFFQAAMIWMLLKAEFLSITLVLVYVGAVMVLFLFVVMMIDIDIEHLRRDFWTYVPMGAFVGAIIIMEMAVVLTKTFMGRVQPVQELPKGFNGPNTQALGKLIYTDYIYAFEVAGAVLLLAIVAAVALTVRRRKDTKAQKPSEQIRVQRKDRVRLVSMPAEKAAGAASADSNG